MKLPILFAVLTGLCWGLYGPALAQSRSALASPFKPYMMIGVAYLFWGIGGGILGMLYKGDSFGFTGAGTLWGLIAGSLGAWGAFTLTLAMFKGGTAMPQVVMPIVFGGAVTVAAITSVLTIKDVKTSPWLWIGVAGMFVCIVIVAYNTPHAPPPKKPPTTESAPAPGA